MGFFSFLSKGATGLGNLIKGAVRGIGKGASAVLESPITNMILQGLDVAATAVPIL